VIFHGVDIGIKRWIKYLLPGANWIIPATYPIVEVLDLSFVESTGIAIGQSQIRQIEVLLVYNQVLLLSVQ
jgi:hypothetical protein